MINNTDLSEAGKQFIREMLEAKFKQTMPFSTVEQPKNKTMKEEKRFDPEAGFMTCEQYVDRYLAMLPNVGLLQEQWEKLPDENQEIYYMDKQSFQEIWATENLEKFGIIQKRTILIHEIDPGNQHPRSITNIYESGIIRWG